MVWNKSDVREAVEKLVATKQRLLKAMRACDDEMIAAGIMVQRLSDDFDISCCDLDEILSYDADGTFAKQEREMIAENFDELITMIEKKGEENDSEEDSA